MKKIYLLNVLLACFFLPKAQCIIDAVANQDTIDCGDSIIIDLNGFSDYALNTNFNSGSAGIGWNTTSSAQYDNPYIPSLTGDTYLWMGPLADVPRTLSSVGLDLTVGGQICFDLTYAPQGNSSPTEGPDEAHEGVSLQYSTDGGVTWIDIAYFCPNGTAGPNGDGIMPSNPGPGSGLPGASANNPTDFNQWVTYCFDIPPGAETSNTMIQWTQIHSTSIDFDHWGIDNVQVFLSDPTYFFVDINTGNPIVTDSAVVYPTGDSIITYMYTDGLSDTCLDTVELYVNPVDAGPDIMVACDGLGIQMVPTGVVPWADVVWSPIDGIFDSNDPFTWVLPNVDTQYELQTDCGVDSLTVFVEDAFTINIDPPDTMCLNGSTQINLSTLPITVPIASVEWTPSSSLNDSVGASVIASPTANTTYVATVTSDSGCVILDSVEVIVQGVATAVEIVPSDPRVCQGDSVSLAAVPITPNFPYTLAPINYSPYPTTGGTVIGGFTDDNVQGPLNIGFNFPYFGSTYTQIWLSSNGWFTFTATANSSLGNTSMPSPNVPNNFIAWAWDDLNWNNGGTFSFYIGGTAPNQYLVLNFIDVPHFGSTTTVSSQVVLYENGQIEFYNINVVPDNVNGNMTLGIEDATGTIGMALPGADNTNYTSIGEAFAFIPYTPPANTIFNWLPPNYLSTTQGDTVNASPPGTMDYQVNMIDGYCVSIAEVTVIVDSLYFDTITPDMSISCPEDSISLYAEGVTTVFNNLQCADVAGMCSTPQDTMQYGTGTAVSGTSGTGNTGNTPFGFWDSDNKRHILYTAAELNALGITGGNIYSIAFNIISKFSTQSYVDVSIGLKCVSDATVSNVSQTGFTNVYFSNSYTTNTGWNTFVFDNPYQWDGVSNLLVQFCFGDGGFFYSRNDHVEITNSGFSCYAWGHTWGSTSNGCNDLTFTNMGTSNSKPNTRFSYCNITPGYADINYQWSSNPSLTIANSDSSVAMILDSITTLTEVYCEISDGVCTHVDTIIIDLSGGHTLTNDTFVCEGGSVQLEATGGLSYTWMPQDGTLSDDTIANPVASPVSDAVYYVDIELATCTVTDSIEVEVLPLPNSTINGGAALAEACVGDVISLYADGDTTYMYSWTGPESHTGDTANVIATGTYTLNIVDTFGCENSTTIDVSNYAVPLATSNAGTNLTEACNGDAGTFITDGPSSWAYSWTGPETGTGSNFTVNTTGNYTMSYIDDNGCLGSTPVAFSYYTDPTITINNGATLEMICDGASVDLIGDSSATWTYNWTGPESGTGQTFTVSTIGTYTLNILDDNGCEGSTSIIVGEADAPEFNTDLLRNILCCNGDEITFTLDSLITNGLDADIVTWNGGASQSVNTPISVLSNEDGIYHFTLTATNGCTSEDSVSFNTECLSPEIVDQDSVVIGTSIPFELTADTTYNSEMWYPQGNFSGNVYTNTVDVNTSMPIWVDASVNYTLSNGQVHTCVETDTSYIYIIGITDPSFADAFTPNGDNINDRFFPVNLDPNATITTFKVYNRWGQEVYSYANDDGWDGVWNGQDQPEDVYSYYIVIDQNTGSYVNSGQFTLIR